jgi:hypothetical protein
MAQIVEECLTDDDGQGEGAGVAGLALRDSQTLSFPVDVIEGERGDLSATQAVGDEQQQDRVVPSPSLGPAIDDPKGPVDVVPRDRSRDARQPVELRPLDGVGQIGRDHALAVGVAQKHPQHPGRVADRALGQPQRRALDHERAEHGR